MLKYEIQAIKAKLAELRAGQRELRLELELLRHDVRGQLIVTEDVTKVDPEPALAGLEELKRKLARFNALGAEIARLEAEL